jgi:hypothetical protein
MQRLLAILALATLLTPPALVDGGSGAVAVASPTAVSTPGMHQARVELWYDVSRSTRRGAVRVRYLARAMQIVDGAINDSAYLRVVAFTGAASNATPIIDQSMEVTAPNSSYLQAAKKRLREEVRKVISRALLHKPSSGDVIPGSDPAGAARYGVVAAKAGIASGASAAVWIVSDGEQTFRRNNLVRLLHDQSPQKVVDRWLRPYVPDARDVDLHFRGLGQGDLSTASTRLSIRIEHVWRRFCAQAKARSCDVTAEV